MNMNDLVRYHCEMYDNENIEKFAVLSDKNTISLMLIVWDAQRRVSEGATVTNIRRNEFIAFGCDIMLFWTRKHHIQKKTMKISNQKGKSQFTDNITCQLLNGQSF